MAFSGALVFHKHILFRLGLHYLYHLTRRPTELRIDLVAADNSKGHETFRRFAVDKGPTYTLSVSQSSGTISMLLVPLYLLARLNYVLPNFNNTCFR